MEIRKAEGLSQTEFAQQMGLTRGVISNIEGGLTKPKDYVIELVCKTFNVSRIWLETGKGEMFDLAYRNALSLLAEEYQLSPREVAPIRAYLKLTKEQRNTILTYLSNVLT